MTQTPTPANGFAELGIPSQLLQALQRMKITTPTPIQHQSIPIGMEGKDILGIAQTGTGKTLAFGVPVLHRLDRFPGRALILLPTRELALQVQETLAPLGRAFGLHTACLIGGVSIHAQIRDLARKPRILIATPGRLIDLLENRRVHLDDVGILVLDEADRMFDMGFAPQLNRIFKLVPKQRQTLLFSATMSPEVLKLATAVMAMPVRIEVAPAGTTAKDIEQEIFIIPRETKLSLLERLLQDISGTMLVFLRTKHGARKVAHTLKLMGHKAAEIHSNRSQAQRRDALSGFKSGKYRVLVATDIAARGIDVDGIEAVVNFDLPTNSEDYVHRIGRTGRAGRKGRAISFATPDQKGEIRSIERLIRKQLTVSQMPGLATQAAPRPESGPAQSPRQDKEKNRPYKLGPKRPFRRRRRHRGSGRGGRVG
ncbi:DEAD/DEAH box helicase [Deltaproteobacteria bacterium PRO3]|nr:DEAD/DEAH box helicase [Deltaproteobacteria bacterium PRO3]